MDPIQSHTFRSFGQAVVMDKAHPTWRAGHPRIFKHQLDHHEHRALEYILENLSKKSMLRIFSIQKKLKEKGNDLEHVHPLAFFMQILSHQHLKGHFHQLRKKNNVAWSEFAKGAINSLKEEKNKQNIHDHHVDIFCERTGKDPYHVRFLIHENRWSDFLSHL